MDNVITLVLPSHWVSALINGDITGLNQRDIDDIDVTGEAYGFNMYTAVSCNDEPETTKYHDAHGHCGYLLCECLEFTFIKGRI